MLFGTAHKLGGEQDSNQIDTELGTGQTGTVVDRSQNDTMLSHRNAPLLRLSNQTRGTILCAKAVVAEGVRGRSRGLLGKNQLGRDEGMLFDAGVLPVMWMHTFFMAFPIDIVFLDRRNTVMRINPALKAWRLSSLVFGARRALELPVGIAAATETRVGDLIVLEAI